MQCSPAIADVLLQIMQIGILRIRSFGWERNAEACAQEADHLHNIPALLSDYSEDRLAYYWCVERICFQEKCTSHEVAFGPMWKILEPLLPTEIRIAEVAEAFVTPVSSRLPQD